MESKSSGENDKSKMQERPLLTPLLDRISYANRLFRFRLDRVIFLAEVTRKASEEVASERRVVSEDDAFCGSSQTTHGASGFELHQCPAMLRSASAAPYRGADAHLATNDVNVQCIEAWLVREVA
eukprot:2279632-Pleurochrysis_carterae.AAC.1